MGTVLNQHLRASDLLARFGGEEFCILIDDVSIESVQNKFEAIRLAFEKNVIEYNDFKINYTVSIGIIYGLDKSLENMINLSDKALYDAKESGRNRVVIHTIPADSE